MRGGEKKTALEVQVYQFERRAEAIFILTMLTLISFVWLSVVAQVRLY